ncbi:dipeptidase [Agromyces aureus]|nr:membrane dipeptidase [Agromyces aureus]
MSGPMLIDGLQCGRYDRESLADLRDAGVGAVTITASFWESSLETMDALATWNDLVRENDDVALLVRTAEDIDAAHASNRVGIVLGTQNASLFDDRLGFVEHFWNMGVRVVQLTYNTQNAIGGSCYEPVDSGLSRFGREIVTEMNRLGMVVDLSHVGDITGVDAIEHSTRPVAINHANAASLYAHPRNKGDRVLDALVAHGGVLGVCTYNNIAGDYARDVRGAAELVVRHVEKLGVEHVAFGSDMSPGAPEDDVQWMRKGRWTRSDQQGAVLADAPPPPEEWMDSPAKIGELASYLVESGLLGAVETDAVFSGNWLRIYREGFVAR